MAESKSLGLAVATARRLATEHPDLVLPCPACAAEVKAENLSKHLDKVHSLGAGGTGERTIHGSDQQMVSVFIGLMLLSFATIFLIPLLVPDSMVGTLMGIPVFAALVLSGALVTGATARFPASVTVGDQGLTFRWGLGLMSRTVTFPVVVESGGLVKSKMSSVVNRGSYNESYRDVDAGSYLRFIGADGSAVTVGAKRSTRPHKFWEFDQQQGEKRRSWNITVEPEELVCMQYLLVDAGVFRARSPSD